MSIFAKDDSEGGSDVTRRPIEYCVLVELVSERRNKYSGTFDFFAYRTFSEAISLRDLLKEEIGQKCYMYIVSSDTHRSRDEWRWYFSDYYKSSVSYSKMRHEDIIKEEWL